MLRSRPDGPCRALVSDAFLFHHSLAYRIISDKSYTPYWVRVTLAPAPYYIWLVFRWHSNVTSSGSCSGLVQPLEVSVNRPFKDILKQVY